MQLTKDVREQLLALNEGFSMKTSYSARNFKEDLTYTIVDRELHVRSASKSSWADSHRVDEYVADDEQTHRFLYTYLSRLATDGVVQGRRPARTAAPEGAPASSDAGVDDESPAESTDGADATWLRPTAVALVVAGVADVIYVVGKPVWQQRVKPGIDRRLAERRQRKLDSVREREAIVAPVDDQD